MIIEMTNYIDKEAERRNHNQGVVDKYIHKKAEIKVGEKGQIVIMAEIIEKQTAVIERLFDDVQQLKWRAQVPPLWP